MIEELNSCSICPRECNADRNHGKLGYCLSGAGFEIASICIHKGEEPAISGKEGICNVFFNHCNIQCNYCQNYQISSNDVSGNTEKSLNEVVKKITAILDSGIHILGFVSPTHCVPQMKIIIHELRKKGRMPVVVYNSNAYDKVETLKSLENIVDVYLPDFKYSDEELGRRLSDAPSYPGIALKAIKEMVRQKGTSMHFDEKGQVESGVIIRHLVLPGFVENSVHALKLLAEEISPFLYISLMSQYYPTPCITTFNPLNRTISSEEYSIVLETLEQCGFYRGWVQELDSSRHYHPDFQQRHPFEKGEDDL